VILLLIALDLEGTLLAGELFTEVGERLGLGDELRAVTRDAMNGDLPFGEALARRTELIRGISMSSIRSVASSMPLTLGAEETVSTLRRMGLTPAIITGGFDLLAAPVADRLGIDHVYANRLAEEHGRVTGLKPPVVTPRAKAECLRHLAAELGTPLERAIAIGDGANDVPMLCTAGLGIAFNAPPRVREAAHASVDGGDLRAILPLVARHLDRNRSHVEAHSRAAELLYGE
jgi:phosphoserine phosphatase